MVQTPTTGHTPVPMPQYDISLVIPSNRKDAQPLVIGALPVSETSFSGQGIDGLIGRDVLDRCVLNCIGPEGVLVLAY